MTLPDRAAELFRGRYNCAQAVFAASGEADGLPLEHCLALAAPFGGGVCRTGAMCGAVTGALMALGVRSAEAAEDPSRKEEIYQAGREFLTRFEERNGSLICRALLGCDISTEAGQKHARDKNLHQTRCLYYVRDAAEILDQLG